MTAAAMMIAKRSPNSSQKCRRRRPHILRPAGTRVAVVVDGEEGISPILLGESGLVGLRPDLTVESGDEGEISFTSVPWPDFSST